MAPPATSQGGDGRSSGDERTGSIIKTIIRSIALFYFVNLAAGYFLGNKSKAPAKTEIPSFDSVDTTAVISNYRSIPQSIAPIWPLNSTVDVSIYVSSSLVMPPLSQAPPKSLVLREKGFEIGNWKEHRVVDTTFPTPMEVQNNSTLWAHIYVALAGSELDPTSKYYDVHKAYHFFRPFNQILPKKKLRKTKNLLGGDDRKDEEEKESQSAPDGPTFQSYYHPNFTISFVPNSGIIQYPQQHPAIKQHIVMEGTGARDPTGQNGWYFPILFVNTFWQLRDYMTELNSTVKALPLHIDLNHVANWKFSLYASIDDNVKQTSRNAANGQIGAGGDGSEFEMFKSILIDTNVYLLGTTFVVSILHMIFEMLAFKSDISHWRNKKDNVGVSVRTILSNVFMQIVIFLYLLDNNEHTSWMILVSQGFGILLEAWKITKTVDVCIRETPPNSKSLLPYTITFEDKHVLSETERKTQEYDEIAFKYMYIFAVPLVLAYAGYSLVYETHKSWYSFIIATLVGSVYAYGFLMMVPSLYINYRLKSVAHMPRKAMTYKFLNTFIDDLFAFTIKMPTLHRLATLRDDVIFFIYIYQAYMYKTDFTRINEFGQGGEEESVEDKKANEPLTANTDGKADANGIAPKELKDGVEKAEATATGTAKEEVKKRR